MIGGNRIGVWLSLVERHVRDVEAEGSNPFTPTTELPDDRISSGSFALLRHTLCTFRLLSII